MKQREGASSTFRPKSTAMSLRSDLRKILHHLSDDELEQLFPPEQIKEFNEIITLLHRHKERKTHKQYKVTKELLGLD